MPKLRMTDIEVQDALLRQAIKGSAAYFKLSVNEQALIAGCTRSTWYRRLNDPSDFSLSELRRMVRRYKWDAKTVAAILGVREGDKWDV